MSEYVNGWLTLKEPDPATPLTVKLSQMDAPTNQEVTDDGSGSQYAEMQALLNYAPEPTGTTPALKTALQKIGVEGTCVGSGFPIEIVDLIYRRISNCKEALPASPHYQLRCTNGLWLPTTLNADRTNDATLAYILHTFTDDAGNKPLAETDGVVTPPSAQIQNERFRLGVCKVADVVFDEIENVTLAFGITITPKEPRLATISPTTAGKLTFRPIVTLTGRDLSKVKDTLIEQKANGATHTNTIFQFVAVQDGASFYDYALLQHMNLTVYGLAVPDNLGTGSAAARATNQITLTAGTDLTNSPIIPTYDVAYNPTP